MDKNEEQNNKVSFVRFLIYGLCVLYIYLFVLFLINCHYYNKGISHINNGNFKEAIGSFSKVIKINQYFLFKKNMLLTFSAMDKIASTYCLYGDINLSQKLFESFHNELVKYTPKDKENIDYSLFSISNNYKLLGYYQEAEKNIMSYSDYFKIMFYTDTHQTKKIDSVLLNTNIIYKNIENIDSIRWTRAIGYYYIETKQYEKAESLYKDVLSKIKKDDYKIRIKILLADLYNFINKYEESKILYEECLESFNYIGNDIIPYDKKLKTEISYFILLEKIGNKELINKYTADLLLKTEKYFYKSPIRICTKHYISKISNFENKKKLQQEVDNLFIELNLLNDSYFKSDIEEFCKINIMRY